MKISLKSDIYFAHCNIKNSLLYSGKNTFPFYGNNKIELDNYYLKKKEFFQLRKKARQLKQEKESERRMWISLIGLGGVIIVALIIWWLFRKSRKKRLKIG